MPEFKTTNNIFKADGCYFDPNLLDSDKPKLPPTQLWSMDRELQIEDIDIWEVITEFSGGGIYAAWCPYAPYFMCVLRPEFGGIQTFYGNNAEQQTKQWASEKGIPLYTYPKDGKYAHIEITDSGLKYRKLD